MPADMLYMYHKELVAKFVFKNCIVKYFSNGERTISRIKAQPQKGDVYLDRNFEPLDDDQVLSQENVFYTFLGLAIDYYTLCQAAESAIGYLLLQNRSCFPPHAFILCPEEDNVEGWAIGKSLTARAIAMMCKAYHKSAYDLFNEKWDDDEDDDDSFFDGYDEYANLLVIEDVHKGFNYQHLYNYITGSWVIKKRIKETCCVNAVVPRMLMCTQTHPGKRDGSFNHRFVVLPMTNFFNLKNRPLTYFGSLLFDSWDEKQWSLFDNYMFYCIEQYIKNGEDSFINLRALDD